MPWGHLTVLLDRLTTQPDRDWYATATATAAAEHGWSRNVLLHHIKSQLHRRVGAAPSNFTDQLPAPDSDLAQQLVRDPYVFDFLNLTGRIAERELEAALMGRLERFLLELGHGSAATPACPAPTLPPAAYIDVARSGRRRPNTSVWVRHGNP